MGVFIAKHKWYRKQKVVVFPEKNFIFVEINHFPGQSVLLKIKENGPVNCFSHDFWFLCFRSPPKGLFLEKFIVFSALCFCFSCCLLLL